MLVHENDLHFQYMIFSINIKCVMDVKRGRRGRPFQLEIGNDLIEQHSITLHDALLASIPDLAAAIASTFTGEADSCIDGLSETATSPMETSLNNSDSRPPSHA